MKQKQFRALTNQIRKKYGLKRLIILTCRILPQIFVVVFLGCAVFLMIQLDLRFWRFCIVPLLGLMLSILLRKLFKHRRPFEIYDFEPLISHDMGESFPSKHAVSSMVIAVSCWYLNLWFGVAMVALSFVVGITRVIAGLHFPKDVLAGWFLGALVGYIGCFLI